MPPQALNIHYTILIVLAEELRSNVDPYVQLRRHPFRPSFAQTSPKLAQLRPSSGEPIQAILQLRQQLLIRAPTTPSLPYSLAPMLVVVPESLEAAFELPQCYALLHLVSVHLSQQFCHSWGESIHLWWANTRFGTL